MKIDVVYKLGVGSKFNDRELRYSLRSLSNFKDLGKVYLIGHKPDWIQDIIHIPLEDVFKANKDANLINKLILASQDPKITQEFINMSDDQLFLKECSYEDFVIPYYSNKLIESFKPNEKLNRWKTRLRNTVRVLTEKGLPSNCYECHIPTLINIYDFTKTVFQYNYPEGQGMCGNTLYFNTLKKDGKPLPENIYHFLESPVANWETLKELYDGKLFFTYTEAAINDNLFLYLDQQFPTKSKYERNE